MFNINFNSDTSLYYQVYSHIVSLIQKGILKECDKLPSKRVLAETLGISIITVENAYSMLLSEGYIFSRPKSGYYVSKISALDKTSTPTVKADYVSSPHYLYNFSTNTVDTSLFPFKTWNRIFKSVLYEKPYLLNHGEAVGDYELRCVVADYISQNRFVKCSPHQIVVGAGVEYLLSILSKMLSENAIFGIENPGYSKTATILKNNNTKFEFISLDDNGISVAALASKNVNVVYVTPSHEFPLGITMPIGRRTELLAWAHANNGYIIEDDYNSEFRFDGHPLPSLQGLDGGKSVIYLSTFSRIIAPSIRIAFMVLPETLLQSYKNYFGDYSSTVSRFEQHTLCEFIEKGHLARHINRSRNLYRQRKNCLINAIKTTFPQDTYEICGESTGLHILLTLKNGLSEDMLVNNALKENIKINGLSRYNMDKSFKTKESSVLLGYSNLDEVNIVKAINLLKKAWYS